MRKARSTAAKTPKKPADSEAGAVLVRKFAIKLFDRDEGEAANWPLIADTLFKAAFDALRRAWRRRDGAGFMWAARQNSRRNSLFTPGA